MADSEDKNVLVYLLAGFGLGALVGAAAGLLFAPKAGSELRGDISGKVKELKDRGDVVLLDARPPPVYEGQGPWAKPGHIPGSINLPWRSIMEPGNTRKLRPIEEVRKAFTSVGATPDKLIICSCGTSREATCEFIALKWLLDYPSVHIYEGAYTEWSSYPENPTVVGKDPY